MAGRKLARKPTEGKGTRKPRKYDPTKPNPWNSIQGKVVPEMITRNFINGLDIEKLTKDETLRLIQYSAARLFQGEHKWLIKGAMDLVNRNEHFGLAAFIVELALRESDKVAGQPEGGAA